MAWLRLDDGFAQHPKIVALTPRDRWTWLELLCYCARYRTEGKVPAGIAEVVRGATPAFLNRCGELRLLDADPDSDGYLVHDFQEYNPPRIEDVDEAVAAFLADNPQASANEVWRGIGGSRNGVLAAVRRYRAGTQSVSSGTDQPVPVPVSRARSRPVPSPSTTPAAAAEPQNAATDAAAAETADQLRAIGLNPAEILADHDPDLVQAWLNIAAHEAERNPAGYVLTGIRTGVHPSPRHTPIQPTPTNYVQRARELYQRTHDTEAVADWLAGIPTLSTTERERILEEIAA